MGKLKHTKRFFVITLFIKKRAVNKHFHHILLPQGMEKQLMLAGLVSVIFGIQVQNLKCKKKSIHKRNAY